MVKKEIDKRVKEYQSKKGGKKYQFTIYLGVDPLTGKKKKTTRRGFASAIAAERALRRIETDVQEKGIKAVEVKKDEKYEVIYELWFDNYKKTVKESTWSSTQQIFDTHILPVFTGKFIGKIDVVFCQVTVNLWADTMPKIFKKIKNYASKVFDYAMSLELISSNPMKIITIPRGEALVIEEKVISFYTRDELLDFLDTIKQENRERYIFFAVLAYTGIRKGEAFALKWSDIDFKNRMVNINKTITRGYKGRLIVNTPKSRSGKRKLYIDSSLIKLLKDFYMSDGKVVQIKSDDFIFNHDGLPYNPTVSRSWLNQIYVNHPELKSITTHGFRHTHASLLFESGATLKDVQERLGHADIQTTANIYTHVTDDKNKQVTDKFATFMSKGESKGESKDILEEKKTQK
ncbi:tyrosine-type recombinase/integrase [Enterococcus xiangfangensis]|uniref:tyrosine-type recombinase/integrase n=1 Tax=Enterococcus xiangfangensis TaxID=1296537 RepID=UPI003D17EBB5|nr:site-specific integrase [Enterococcus asini]